VESHFCWGCSCLSSVLWGLLGDKFLLWKVFGVSNIKASFMLYLLFSNRERFNYCRTIGFFVIGGSLVV